MVTVLQIDKFTDLFLQCKVFAYILKKIRWFLVFLIFVLFASAHSLMVLLSDTLTDNGANTFTGFYQSLKNSWSMLLNNYSSLEPWTNNYLLDIFMIVFSLSTAIVLFNILIAIISDSYKITCKKAHTIWVMELVELMAEFELCDKIMPMFRIPSPTTVIYRASAEDVDEWATKLEKEKILIPWEDDYEFKIAKSKLEEVVNKLETTGIRDIWMEIGARVQGHCGAKCKVCGWEKKANAKTDELETHIGLRCIKSNHDNQQRIDEHYDSLKIANSKVQMANQALIKLFVCCGIPFHLVQHPFFVDFIKILCPAYSLPSRQQLSANMLNSEISHIQIKINGILENETCLTGKEFIHSIQNLSKESHTSQYIAKKIIEVIESVGAEKFSAVVSDNASSMVKAKKLVNEKYENIMPI
ncbi:8415_t:CDS:2, partial [Rhizophagus irregularis]